MDPFVLVLPIIYISYFEEKKIHVAHLPHYLFFVQEASPITKQNMPPLMGKLTTLLNNYHISLFFKADFGVLAQAKLVQVKQQHHRMFEVMR